MFSVPQCIVGDLHHLPAVPYAKMITGRTFGQLAAGRPPEVLAGHSLRHHCGRCATRIRRHSSGISCETLATLHAADTQVTIVLPSESSLAGTQLHWNNIVHDRSLCTKDLRTKGQARYQRQDSLSHSVAGICMTTYNYTSS